MCICVYCVVLSLVELETCSCNSLVDFMLNAGVHVGMLKSGNPQTGLGSGSRRPEDTCFESNIEISEPAQGRAAGRECVWLES